MFSKRTILFALLLVITPAVIWGATLDTDLGFVELFSLVDSQGDTLEINSDGSIPITGGSGSSGDPFSFISQHTSYSNGLSQENIYRLHLPSGDTLTIDRMTAVPKGGGTDTATVSVYNVTDATEVASTELNGSTISPGTVGTGDTVAIRVSNNTGAAIPASITAIGTIE